MQVIEYLFFSHQQQASVLCLDNFLLKSPFCTGVIFLLYWTVSCKTDRKCGRERMGSGQLLKNGTETLQFWMHGLQPTL